MKRPVENMKTHKVWDKVPSYRDLQSLYMSLCPTTVLPIKVCFRLNTEHHQCEKTKYLIFIDNLYLSVFFAI